MHAHVASVNSKAVIILKFNILLQKLAGLSKLHFKSMLQFVLLIILLLTQIKYCLIQGQTLLILDIVTKTCIHLITYSIIIMTMLHFYKRQQYETSKIISHIGHLFDRTDVELATMSSSYSLCSLP